MKARIPQILLIASLLTSVVARPTIARASGYTAFGPTYLNVYFNDGSASSLTASGIGGTVSPYSPTLETVQTTTGIGMPLTSYGSGSWLQTGGSSAPGATTSPLSATFLSPGLASASVGYTQGSFYGGSNTLTSSYLNPYGTSLVLTHTGTSGIAELRLDYTTTYLYTGPPPWSAGLYAVGQEITDINGNAELCVGAGTTSSTEPGWPTSVTSGTTTPDGGVTWMIIPTIVPTSMNLGISATVPAGGDYFALAGQETFDVNSTTSSTFEIPWAGSFVSSASLPSGLSSGLLDSGLLGASPGLFGFSSPGTFNQTVSTFGSGGTLYVQDGDLVTMSGYLDLFVDPASVRVQVTPIVQSTLAITNSAMGPLVYFPMITPGNHVLQMCTNLRHPMWVAVTNGIPATVTNTTGDIFGGLIITNKTKTAFFRLH